MATAKKYGISTGSTRARGVSSWCRALVAESAKPGTVDAGRWRVARPDRRPLLANASL